MRLHRLHLSSSPPSATLAINWPHSQRVSLSWRRSGAGLFVLVMVAPKTLQMKLRTIINISTACWMSSGKVNGAMRACADVFLDRYAYNL